MDTSTLTSKGQLLIPKRLRVKYGLKPGAKVIFQETKSGLVLKPMDETYFNQFIGILKDQAPNQKEVKAWKNEEKKREDKKSRIPATASKSNR